MTGLHFGKIPWLRCGEWMGTGARVVNMLVIRKLSSELGERGWREVGGCEVSRLPVTLTLPPSLQALSAPWPACSWTLLS